MDTTLIKGLGVLEALAASREPRGITELAAELGLMKSNVHRVLQTLTRCGYVRKDAASGRYLCTLKMWKLGGQVADHLDLRTLARPHLVRLAEASGETVHLSMLEGTQAHYLDKIDSPQPVRAFSRLGGGGPAHCSATGKALLAYAPPEVVTRIAGTMTRFTARTIVDKAKLTQEIRTIRKNGYAITRGEWHEAVSGLAAPILNSPETAIAAVGISGPSERLPLAKLRALAPIVLATAQDIAAELG